MGLIAPGLVGSFPDQRSNPSPLHWQAYCYPLSHQGSPRSFLRNLLILAALGLPRYTQAFSSCIKQRLLFLAEHGLLIAVASSVAELGLRRAWASEAASLQALECRSVVVVQGHSCSKACGIFLDQASNPCPLHWQVDSYPLYHQRSPKMRP